MKKRKQPKRKHSFLKIFAIIMIVGGVLTLLYPIVGNYLANRERSQAVSQYDDTMKKMSQKEKDEQWTLAKAYNEYIYNLQEGLPKGEPVV